jgi:hypothetical protein
MTTPIEPHCRLSYTLDDDGFMCGGHEADLETVELGPAPDDATEHESTPPPRHELPAPTCGQ